MGKYQANKVTRHRSRNNLFKCILSRHEQQKQSAKATAATIKHNKKKTTTTNKLSCEGVEEIYGKVLPATRKWQTNDATTRRHGRRTQGQHVKCKARCTRGKQIAGQQFTLADSARAQTSSKSCFHFSSVSAKRLGQGLAKHNSKKDNATPWPNSQKTSAQIGKCAFAVCCCCCNSWSLDCCLKLQARKCKSRILCQTECPFWPGQNAKKENAQSNQQPK